MTIKQIQVRLSEIYISLEGEGVYAGVKTLFVRFAGCHLKCFYCDTPESLAHDGGQSYLITEAQALIDRSLAPNIYKVNFTGGEPLNQHEALAMLAQYAQAKGLKTYLESSCYSKERFCHVLPYIDICKIEFKLSDAGATDKKHQENFIVNELACLKAALDASKKTYIKIVVTQKSLLSELESLLARIFFTAQASDLEGFIIQPAWGAPGARVRSAHPGVAPGARAAGGASGTSGAGGADPAAGGSPGVMDKPSPELLLRFYDAVYPYYPQVRVLPQMHKILGLR